MHYKKFFGGNGGNKQITSLFFFYHKSVKYNRTKINLITSSSGSRYSLIVLDLFIKSFNSSSFTCLHNGQVFLPRYVEYTCMYITNYTIFPTRPTIKKLLGSRSLICLWQISISIITLIRNLKTHGISLKVNKALLG